MRRTDTLIQILLMVAFLIFPIVLIAQPGQGSFGAFNGTVIDSQTKEPLAGANIMLISMRDSTRKFGVISDANGLFSFPRVRQGMKMILRISFVGYETRTDTIGISLLDKVQVFELKESLQQLEEVQVTGVQTRVEMKGDTAMYNAAAFKVNKDADAQDLITKMPGVVTTNGKLEAQGEQVKRVLVDGQEFFGDDPTLALKSLPAEVISQIQIFDRQSDQSQFTGFNDGNTEKTINIITNGRLSNGTFGRLFGGYGTDSKYQAGGNLNYFNNAERVSIIGMSNNMNLQNFSAEDLAGVAQSAQGNRPPSNFRGGGRMGGGSRGSSGANPNDFLIGQNAGINTTNSLGINYSNVYKEKFKLNASYFYNATENATNQVLQRELILQNASNQYYDETSIGNSENGNHRFSVRGEYTINENNSLLFTPRVSFQNYSGESALTGNTTTNLLESLSTQNNATDTKSNAFSINSSLLWRHRFEKQRRTFSLNWRSTLNQNRNESRLNSDLRLFVPTDSTTELDQFTNGNSFSNSMNVSANFTEPIGETMQMMLTYTPDYSWNTSKTDVNQYEELTGRYSLYQDALSGNVESNSQSHRAGIGLRWSPNRGLNAMISLNAQTTHLAADQSIQTTFTVSENYTNLLPFGMFSYSANRNISVRLFYRTSTDLPSVSQLQPLVNNSNPLFLSSGNPELNQQYSHSLFMRVNKTNTETGKSLFIFANATVSQSYIGSETILASTPTLLENGFTLQPGGQFSKPINLDGYSIWRTFLTYSQPVLWIKSTLNLNGGVIYSKTPSRINGSLNSTNSMTYNGGFTVASNISTDFDFTLNYTGNYVIAENKIQPELNVNYFNGLASAKVQWILFKSVVLNSDVTYSHYNGLADSFNQNFVLWNAALGYKFLKNKSAEVRLSVFDILKANTNINRTVTETYIEDSQTKIIQQFFLLTFTYTLRNFKGV